MGKRRVIKRKTPWRTKLRAFLIIALLPVAAAAFAASIILPTKHAKSAPAYNPADDAFFDCLLELGDDQRGISACQSSSATTEMASR